MNEYNTDMLTICFEYVVGACVCVFVWPTCPRIFHRKSWRATWNVTVTVRYVVELFTGGDLRDFVIELLLSKSSAATVCGKVKTALKTKETRHIGCRLGSVGRIVRIRMSGAKPKPLTLCEVEVYGGMYICWQLLNAWSAFKWHQAECRLIYEI